jgi:aryl-alcohol dehydrogenase-like predicted oxidoreductase
MFLIFIPILGFSQVESKLSKTNYSDSDIKKFVSIKRENVSAPISDDEVIDMVKKSGMTLEEYGLLIKQSFSGNNGRVNTKPQNAKEQKLAEFVNEGNFKRAAAKERQLETLCAKHGLTKVKYDAMVSEVGLDMTLRSKVIEALSSNVTPKK